MMKSNTRLIAVEALNEIDNSSIPSQTVLEKCFYKYHMNHLDRGLIHETVKGVLRNRGLLDWIIRKALPHERIAKDLLNFFRVGIYQIHFLDKIPSYAVVNEIVAAMRNRKDKGFANAVLRKLAQKITLFPTVADFENEEEYLRAKYSHPSWIVELLIERFGKEKAISLLKHNNAEALTSIRVNKLRIGRNQLIEKLAAKDIEVSKTPVSPDGLIIHKQGIIINRLDVYTGGACDIQKESSQIVSLILNPREHERVLDACAGSGGKTLHISALMKNTGEITAIDKNNNSLIRLRTNQKRLGSTNIRIIQKDFLTFEPRNLFDRVLIDAPCSGLGTISRNPEVRWRKNKSDCEVLTRIQYSLLAKGATCVQKNGKLVYSVCTITEEETEGIIASFLSAHKNFHLIHINHKFIPTNSRYNFGKLLIFPHEAMEGFFIALLERV